MGNTWAKRWFVYKKPTGANGVATFNITISASYYDSNSNYSQMRFKIIDTNDFSIVYDSNLDTMAYRTKYTNPYQYAEKAKLNLTLGKEYYIYTPQNLQSSISLLKSNFNLSVGQAIYQY